MNKAQFFDDKKIVKTRFKSCSVDKKLFVAWIN